MGPCGSLRLSVSSLDYDEVRDSDGCKKSTETAEAVSTEPVALCLSFLMFILWPLGMPHRQKAGFVQHYCSVLLWLLCPWVGDCLRNKNRFASKADFTVLRQRFHSFKFSVLINKNALFRSQIIFNENILLPNSFRTLPDKVTFGPEWTISALLGLLFSWVMGNFSKRLPLK